MMKKKILALAFSFVVFIIAIVGVEVISYYVYENHYKSDDVIYPLYWDSFFESILDKQEVDFLFPFKDNPFIGKVFKDAYNATIKNGLRYTPDNNLNGHKHFLFLGCSFTFGVGVKDNETLPNFFAKTVKDSRVYNFGLPGFGPAETLTLLRRKPVYPNYEKIKDLPVVGVFTFFPDHVNRTALNFSHLLHHNPLNQLVEYRLEDGKVVGGEKLFKSNFPKFFFYHVLKRSKLLRIFLVIEMKKWRERNAQGIFEELNFSEKDTLLTLNVMKEIEREFKALFPNGHFYAFTIEPDIGFIERLTEMGGSTFGAKNSFRTTESLPDGHFNPKGLNDLSLYIIQNLKERGVLSDEDLVCRGDCH